VLRAAIPRAEQPRGGLAPYLTARSDQPLAGNPGIACEGARAPDFERVLAEPAWRPSSRAPESVQRFAGREALIVAVDPRDGGLRFVVRDFGQHALTRQGILAREHLLRVVGQACHVVADDIAHQSDEYQVG